MDVTELRMVQTVLGPISSERLGVTLAHEHIIIDIRNWWQKPHESRFEKYVDSEIDLESVQEVRRAALSSRFNLVLDDLNLAVKELNYYRKAGGISVLDMTLPGIGRDPPKLKKISQLTGVNIICGTGYYVQSSHPPEVARKSIDALAEDMVSEIETGIKGSDVRAGMIGEIGISPTGIQSNEEKVLRAAAKAHKETRVPIAVHTWSGGGAPGKIPTKVLDLLEGLDVDLKHVALCHMDWVKDWKYVAELAERGPFVAFDCWGLEFPFYMYNQIIEGSPIVIPTDYERALGVKELCEIGLANHLHMAHDLCQKAEIKKYGGWGYDHILLNVIKLFAMIGVSEKQFKNMMVDNPKNFFG